MYRKNQPKKLRAESERFSRNCKRSNQVDQMTRKEASRILGLVSNSTLDDAKKAYRGLVKVMHPDKDPSPGAKLRFILVQNAYESNYESTCERQSF